MRPIQALARKALTFGGTGGFVQPPFWANEMLVDSVSFGSAGARESIATSFDGYVQAAYKSNGIVFACVQARARVFSEARFQYQRFTGGRPTDLFGDATLGVLERPWTNGTTGELLTRMEQDGSLAGNFFATPVGEGEQRTIRRLRPDWVTIVTGSPSDDPFDLNAKVLGYWYQPRGGYSTAKPVLLTPDRVVHWSPIPDPEAQWRGMSWLTPVVREIEADSAATRHKLKFFENGAVANFVVTYDASISRDNFERFVAAFKAAHQGTDNAYKTIHLGGGADAKTVGGDLKQLDFKVTQGAGETRIAAAAGAHPVIVALSEGMQGSSLNTGNFGAAKRLFADATIRPLWRSAAAALAPLVPVPSGARLWYDDRDIPFLKEDQQDAAQILATQATAMRQLLDAGFGADDVVRAITAGDLGLLTGKHSGLFSVQLQPPGSNGSVPATAGRE